MTFEELQQQLKNTQETVHALQEELAETNRGLVALALELEQRIEDRDIQLRAAHAALERSNTELTRTEATVRALQEELSETNRGLVAMTLELEQRVDERTAQLRQLNLQLEARVEERTAELREANENLQHFAHMAAHDMRSPLRAINAFCSMVLEGETSQIDPESRSLLRRATQSAAQMQQLLDDLLEYSQLGEKQLNLEEVNLNDAVSNALALLDGDLRARNALLTVENTPRGVLGHPPTLILIISNFVSNALKFVAPGVQPQIRIWAEESDPSSALLMSPLKQFVRLYIQDNGIGIAPKDLGKIFEIFQRLHGKGAYPGTGLGLAIVRKGAERMGGKVGVESQPGQGSKFWIELPGTSGTNSSKV